MRIRTHKKQITVISNATAQSDYLSWGALGLLTYCLSMPPDWDFRPQVIWKETKGGRNQLYGLFNELIEEGHCLRIRQPNKHPNMQHLAGEIRYEIFDDVEECKAAAIRLSETERFIECKEEFKKSFRHPNNWDSSSQNPQGGVAESWEEYKETNSYKETETKETTTKDTAAVFSDHKKKEQPYDKIVQLKVYDCLLKIDIPDNEKTWLVKHYSEECVKNAIEWVEATKDKIKTTYIAYLKMACERGLSVRDLPKEKMDTFEELKLHFKDGEVYSNATCYLKPTVIAFERGMRNESIEINKFFCWKKFKSLCEGFGIEFDRSKK